MATKKKGLHASKRRSNSSPELELQVIDTDTKTDHLSAHIVAGNGREANAGAEQCKLTSNHGDSSKEAQTLESQSSDSSSPIVLNQCQVKCASCGSIRGERKTLGPSVRSKVKTSHLKTKKLPKNRQKNVVSTDRVMMDVDNHSESATTSGSDTEDAAELSSKQFKKQGIGRVASAFVAKFRPKAHRHRRRSSNTDSDSSSSAKEVPEETFRPRSKSFSGRIMRKFGTKEKAMNGKDSPRRDLTWRKARSHTSRIQSCIGVVFTGKGTTKKGKPSKTEQETNRPRRYTPVINLEEFNPDDYPIESEDDIQRVLREQEIRDGVDPPPGFQPHFLAKAESHSEPTAKVPNAKKTCQEARRVEAASPGAGPYASNSATYPTVHAPSHTTANIYDQYGSLTPEGNYIPRTVHTQIDYMHCLVPDQENIMNSSFYWGKIDRFEADLLLENKPEGTFLLRDSAHDEFVFSVSFRRYGRTLHARIEQWKHKFSFDAHDPGVYSDDTISGLLKHYKDPNFCMFFEPMLTIPLPRPNPPSLQELARATICSHTTYDGIAHLALPRTLKEFAREYHYKQRVRMRRFEVPEMPIVPEPTMGVITKTCISR